MKEATDKPVAGLLQDLKGRGMLEDTLVAKGFQGFGLSTRLVQQGCQLVA